MNEEAMARDGPQHKKQMALQCCGDTEWIQKWGVDTRLPSAVLTEKCLHFYCLFENVFL
jgi:hypothetical protein